MYSIKKTDYGFELALAGILTVDEMEMFKSSLNKEMAQVYTAFRVIVDVREMITPTHDIIEMLGKCDILLREAGAERFAIIAYSPVVKSQAKEVAFLAGGDEIEKVIDARVVQDWRKVAMNWLLNGVVPETSPAP